MAIKSFQRLLMFESQIMSGCFTYFPCWQKLKQKVRFTFPHKCSADIFSELYYSSVIQTLMQVQRKFLYFKTHLTVQLRSLQLTFNFKRLIFNIMPCKRKYQEKSRTNFINDFQVMNILN